MKRKLKDAKQRVDKFSMKIFQIKNLENNLKKLTKFNELIVTLIILTAKFLTR